MSQPVQNSTSLTFSDKNITSAAGINTELTVAEAGTSEISSTPFSDILNEVSGADGIDSSSPTLSNLAELPVDLTDIIDNNDGSALPLKGDSLPLNNEQYGIVAGLMTISDDLEQNGVLSQDSLNLKPALSESEIRLALQRDLNSSVTEKGMSQQLDYRTGRSTVSARMSLAEQFSGVQPLLSQDESIVSPDMELELTTTKTLPTTPEVSLVASKLAEQMGLVKLTNATGGSAAALDNLVNTTTAISPAVTQTSSSSSSTVPPPINVPIQSPGFDSELANRVVWMVKKDLQVADVKINPQHLGPIELRVSVNNDQATLMLSANNSLTREALELALPRLREMLNDAGLNLTDATISSNTSSGQGDDRQHTENENDSLGEYDSNQNNDSSDESNTHAVTLKHDGLLDYFA